MNDILTRRRLRTTETGMDRLLLEAGRSYTHAHLAVKEYITNAIDAVYDYKEERGQGGIVSVTLAPEEKRVTIRDAGFGMNWKRLNELPERVGESVKKGTLNQRGEKGIGLLAFTSLGKEPKAYIISKTKQESEFNFLVYEVIKERDEERIAYSALKIGRNEVDRKYGGAFEHGTKIVLDIERAIFAEHFNAQKLKKFLKDTYTPLLFSENIPIYFGVAGEESQRLERGEIKGKEYKWMLRFDAWTSVEDGAKKELEYPIEVRLFLDPTKKDGKVGVFAKDVRVYNNVSLLEEKIAELPLFGSGVMSGYINSSNLALTLGREGVRRDTRAYKMLIERLKELNEREWPDIEKQIAKMKLDEGDKEVKDMCGRLKAVYQLRDLKPLNTQSRIATKKKLQLIEPQTPEEEEEDETDDEKVKRKFPFVSFKTSFLQQEKNLRSKLGEELGRPAIIVNSDHPHYARYVTNGTSQEKEVYLSDIETAVVASWEALEAEKKGKLTGDIKVTLAETIRRAQDLKFALLQRRDKEKQNGKA